jgi:hypothetical protein
MRPELSLEAIEKRRFAITKIEPELWGRCFL